MLRTFHIGKYERGFLFRKNDFVERLDSGRHWFWDPWFRLHVDRVPLTQTAVDHPELAVMVKVGAFSGQAEVVDVKDHERALVWVDGRLYGLYRPGVHVFWNVLSEVRVEILDARSIRLDHQEESAIVKLGSATALIEAVSIAAEETGLLYVDGKFQETLAPGRYLFWKGEANVVIRRVDRRVEMLEIQGQEIMTADKLSLRLNAVVSYRVADPVAALQRVQDFRQSIYRDVQLSLRSAIGAKTLDELLSEKERISETMASTLVERLTDDGIELISVGIRDIILPGEMKELLNRVTEASKAAEANLITRREETAALRSQLNAARLLESNPVLMRMRELEVLEKVAAQSKLSVMLGESGLSEKVLKLI